MNIVENEIIAIRCISGGPVLTAGWKFTVEGFGEFAAHRRYFAEDDEPRWRVTDLATGLFCHLDGQNRFDSAEEAIADTLNLLREKGWLELAKARWQAATE